MKLEDLNQRERELYECRCPPDNPCRQEDCAAFKAYYDALFAGKPVEEAVAVASATVPPPPAKGSGGNGKPARKPTDCVYFGEWTGKLCDQAVRDWQLRYLPLIPDGGESGGIQPGHFTPGVHGPAVEALQVNDMVTGQQTAGFEHFDVQHGILQGCG